MSRDRTYPPVAVIHLRDVDVGATDDTGARLTGCHPAGAVRVLLVDDVSAATGCSGQTRDAAAIWWQHDENQYMILSKDL